MRGLWGEMSGFFSRGGECEGVGVRVLQATQYALLTRCLRVAYAQLRADGLPQDTRQAPGLQASPRGVFTYAPAAAEVNTPQAHQSSNQQNDRKISENETCAKQQQKRYKRKGTKYYLLTPCKSCSKNNAYLLSNKLSVQYKYVIL